MPALDPNFERPYDHPMFLTNRIGHEIMRFYAAPPPTKYDENGVWIPDYDDNGVLIPEFDQYGTPFRDSKYAGLTLGAYRRGRHLFTSAGSIAQGWIPCARMMHVINPDGFGHDPLLSWPHAFFMQTETGAGVELPFGDSDGSMHCEGCRAELRRLRLQRPDTSAPAIKSKHKSNPNQGSLF